MLYDKEKMKELINNPLFREANAKLVKQFEWELKQDEAEKKIREYLREHPGVSYAKLVIDTNVDAKIVEDLIAQGRIDVKLSGRDRDELESMQKEVLQGLAKVGKNLADKDFSRKKLQQNIADEKAADTKASGMYSKKEDLRGLNKK